MFFFYQKNSFIVIIEILLTSPLVTDAMTQLTRLHKYVSKLDLARDRLNRQGRTDIISSYTQF